MWSAQELDEAYLVAIASVHPRREKQKPGPPLLVAGLTRKCLKHLPEYTGCNHQDILEAARVCAGGDRSTRVHDNRDFFPVKVGRDPEGNQVSLVYDWDDARELAGRINFAYVDLASRAKCPDGRDRNPSGYFWATYVRCTPDHAENCKEATANPSP